MRLDFLVLGIGPGTRRLCALEPGERLWIHGPLGRPFAPPSELSEAAAGAILVGGGIGIAPLALWRRRLSDAPTISGPRSGTRASSCPRWWLTAGSC